MRNFAIASATIAAMSLAACNFSVGNPGGNNNFTTAASTTKHFANSRARAVSAVLQQNYLDFSFDYPERWNLTPQRTDGTERNYVRVAAPMINGFEPYAFHVGYVTASGNTEADRHDLEDGAPGFARQFGSSFNDYQLISVGPERVGRYPSYGWRFTASAPGPNQGPPVRIYGRGDFILQPGATRGLTLVTLVTDRASDSQSAEQVGETGPLKAIFDSLNIAGGGVPGK
jgi:hypothetical protein